MILSKRKIASKILFALMFSAGIVAGDYIRDTYITAINPNNHDNTRYQISQILVNDGLADVCSTLDIYYSGVPDMLHDVTAECETSNGVYHAREAAIANIDHTLIEDAPEFYTGIEILSEVKQISISSCNDGDRCLTVNVDTHNEKIMALLNSGSLGEKINPLLVRMELSSKQI